jgi:uncharacterized protein (TIGR02466 family)
LAAANVSDQAFNVEHFYHFPSTVSIVDGLKFLDVVSFVAEEELAKTKSQNPNLDDIYPVRMTGNFFDDERVREFADFVATSAWKVLTHQGYATDSMGMFFTEMWVQEHHKHSLMEQHVHGAGSQMIGFYFLNAPEKCSNALFHDPRPGKVQTNLPEKDLSQATIGSNAIHFVPKPGMLLLANSWLPHSFSRHASEEPLLFVHFNLGVQFQQYCAPPPAAEIV